MDKRFLAILAAIAAIFVGIIVFTGDDKSSSSTTNAKPTSHITGNKDAKVTLVEYGDFECPACKQYYPILKELKQTYGDRVAFQFRHFPLTSIHPNALAGSRAAEAAGLQGKFWEMHDLLYESQSSASGWVPSGKPQTFFDDYAKQLGIDVAKFQSDFKSDVVNSSVTADRKEGEKIKISGTPSFVLNGTLIETPGADVAAFKKILDEALAE